MKPAKTSSQIQKFRGLSWDEPLTQEKIKHIEDTFGPLAKNLIELADLVRKSYCPPEKGKPDPSQPDHVIIECSHQIETDRNSFMAVPPESYGLVIRVLASAKLLRTEIESAAGGELPARKFQEAMVSAFEGLDIKYWGLSASGVSFKGRNQVETIAKTLENWHSKDLLIHTSTQQKEAKQAKTNLPAIEQLLDDLVEAGNRGEKTTVLKTLYLINRYLNRWNEYDLQKQLDNLRKKELKTWWPSIPFSNKGEYFAWAEGKLIPSRDPFLERLEDFVEAVRQVAKTPTEASGGSERDNIQETSKTTKRKVEAIRVQVFISYSHKDERWLSDLLKHLKPYVRDESITAWSDRQITPGSKWLPEIEEALALTKVAVLLVTPDFLASDFIHEKELGPLLKEAEKGGVRILWIPVRACSYKKTPLKNYQAVIDPDKPLVNFRLNRDKTWVSICEEIERAVKS